MNGILLNGKEIKLWSNKLDLSEKGTNSISEISGLENIPDLKELNLYENYITEIEGLENLTDLEELHLGCN